MRIEELRSDLATRLRDRQEEIEQAALTRVHSVADPDEHAAPEYLAGLKATVCAALEYGIAALEHAEDRAPPIPTVLLTQARLAARSGVGLNTVLRRYLAGYTLLGDFLIEESAKGGQLNGPSLKRLLRIQAGLFDRVIAAVSEEYEREVPAPPQSGERRLGERVQGLLEGKLLDTSDIPYDLGAFHLGLVAARPDAAASVRGLARSLDRLALVVPGGQGVWAWLGGREPLCPQRLRDELAGWGAQGTLALGAPGEGPAGWRLTHRQAQAAASVALQSGAPVVHYADVAPLASALQDDLLATSLRQIYLAPLGRERDGGRAAKETLRAYFAAGRKVSSTAAALGVSRQTASARLHSIETRLQRTLESCAVELEIALRLEGIEGDASLP